MFNIIKNFIKGLLNTEVAVAPTKDVVTIVDVGSLVVDTKPMKKATPAKKKAVKPVAKKATHKAVKPVAKKAAKKSK